MAVEPPYRVKNMVPGMIMLWHGSLGTVPSGWAICDGTQGTPNLTNRFVRMPGPGNAQGNTGGSSSHNHTFTGDGHAHDLAAGANVEFGDDYKHGTDTVPATGTTDLDNNLPDFYSLYYIMKLPIP